MEDRISRQLQEQVVDHYQSGSGADTLIHEALTMTVRDFVVRCDTSTAAFVVTLPPVVQAKGKIYTIKLIDAPDDGGAVHDLTITTLGTAPYKDAMRWNGSVVIDRPGEAVIFFSDGEAWHILSHSVGAPMIFKKHIHEMFDYPMLFGGKNEDTGIPGGSAGDENIIFCGSGNFLEYHILGTQTLMAPDWADPGLDLSMDDTDDDGVEICSGIGAATPVKFTVGTDGAFFCRCKFYIETVLGTDDCAFGFRIRAAYQGNIDDYTDMAVFNIQDGVVNTQTAINNAIVTTTDTTLADWADGETHIVEVRVSALGVVTYLYDGAEPTTVAAFTFDTGDSVVPFFFLLNDDTTYDAVIIYEWEAGYQA